MKYASLFSAALFTSIVLSPSAQAQERAASPLLPKIFATFRAADLNRDGDLTQEERDAVGLPKEDGKAFDLDSDGLWCEGEFVLYYRRLLKRNGKKIDRELEVEAGRINRAYKDATDRGLNRDAAQRAAEAVRAGTLQAAQEGETPEAGSSEALPGSEDAAPLSSGFDVESTPSTTLTASPSDEEPATESFLPERVEIEPEPEDLPAEGAKGLEQPIAVPPPFEVPTWAPAPENPIVENEEAAAAPLQEEPVILPSDPEMLPAQEEEPPFVVPEFTRPEAVLPPAPQEERSEAAPEVLEVTEVEPAPEESSALEIEFVPGPAPSIPSPVDESTSYDVFGEPTLDVPEEEVQAPLEDPEVVAEEAPNASPDQDDAPAAPVEPEESEPVKIDRPLTDRELDELRQEEDAQAARDRYGFPDPDAPQPDEEPQSEEPQPEESQSQEPQPEGSKESDQATDKAEPTDGDSKAATDSPKTPEKEESDALETPEAKTPAAEDAAKPAREKPLSLWERADRARKLREKREQEAKEAEKAKEKPAEKPSADPEEGESEGPF